MDSGCRLCNSNLQLINIFEIPQPDSKQLKKCIEIATGLTIHDHDDMGKFVCQCCCDVAIRSYKFRINAQRNSIHKRNELSSIKKSNIPRSAFRKPGPKCAQRSVLLQDELSSTNKKSNIPQSPTTSFRKPGPKCAQRSLQKISPAKYNISPSTSQILLRYPSLQVPKELYTANILPTVNMRDIRVKLESDDHLSLMSPTSTGHYQITNVNTTKLSLKKLKHRSRSNSFSSVSDWNEDAGNFSDELERPMSSKSSSHKEPEANLLIPVTYKDEFVCTVCNKLFKLAAKLEVHMQKYHKQTRTIQPDHSSDASSTVNSKSSMSDAPASKWRGKKRKLQSDTEDECSDVSTTSSVTQNRKQKTTKTYKKRELILKITRLEDDPSIQRKFPNILDTWNDQGVDDVVSVLSDRNDEPVDISDTEAVTPTVLFNSAWTKGIKSHEKQKVHGSFMHFLRTRMPEKSLNHKRVGEKASSEVQATAQLDEQYKLDGMGLNEMEVLLPELSVYNVPVSILKQPQSKEMTAFFIQYSPVEAVSKPIDWSKLTPTDLHGGIRRTSTPLGDSVELEGSGTMPTLMALMKYRRKEV